ncbi:3-hydroxyacyl-CoA dehydrogenase family protein [Halovivax gelatinilyticus]|uniref:3-hydroxyacyl-CoA dehydrogenase family protein n=1 Tax=Halovivax gelatinilyticus TaxID=2961597 RepID=UPI0020CA94C0|nr:3-hydroxyacyl-CoA dehydrogenase family protein [Halovivax gelatinilyticus]
MQVAVLGAGTMGRGIAQVCAQAGNEVRIRDLDDQLVDDGIDAIAETLQGGVDRQKVTPSERRETLDRIDGTTDLAGAVDGADVVIEAVPEDLELKRETFAQIEPSVADETIIASNTSSLSVTAISNVLDTPGRAIGLHFFNPVHLMDLVEIVVPGQATPETVAFAESFVEELGKEPITVEDTAGFASSRLGIALGVEAIRMLETGVAGPRDIDRAMTIGYNHPMGPIELTDVVGLDVRLDILEHLRDELGERFRPPQLLRRQVRAGHLGKKTGEGFYQWEDGEIVGVSDSITGTVGGDADE